MRPAAAACVAVLAVLAGCGSDDPSAPPSVEVAVGSADVSVDPTQFCLDGERQRYSSVTPPILEVPTDSSITITVPQTVADRGWSVQVFDDQLEEKLGAVEVEAGTSTFDGIGNSEALPAAFYLVVVENKGTACGEFSGAWPIGFIRSTGDTGTPDSTSPTPEG